ncbi:hypothetical protein BFW88_19775 [Pseudomonas fluorescens]|nr:hypothetical protein BFW88_19775 [Pseudomonas fluorescens]OPB06545.1 hypothetical protein BFW92_19720 [Pseudomonas fluorescens]OPB17830.1 hypothetical protein BFW93_19750 [Pseudomonas fluorescens]
MALDLFVVLIYAAGMLVLGYYGMRRAKTLGFVTALVFMFKDGLDANIPIYYSLAVGLVSFVLVSLVSRRPEQATARTV